MQKYDELIKRLQEGQDNEHTHCPLKEEAIEAITKLQDTVQSLRETITEFLENW